MDLFARRFLCFLFCCATVFPAGWLSAQEFDVDGSLSGTNIIIGYESDTNYYYILYAGSAVTAMTNPLSMALGKTNGCGQFESQNISEEKRAEFYSALSVSRTASLDLDDDIMPDVYELENPPHDPLDPEDHQYDFDEDRLINVYEYQVGSDPLDPDTDDDSISDGGEFDIGPLEDITISNVLVHVQEFASCTVTAGIRTIIPGPTISVVEYKTLNTGDLCGIRFPGRQGYEIWQNNATTNEPWGVTNALYLYFETVHKGGNWRLHVTVETDDGNRTIFYDPGDRYPDGFYEAGFTQISLDLPESDFGPFGTVAKVNRVWRNLQWDIWLGEYPPPRVIGVHRALVDAQGTNDIIYLNRLRVFHLTH